MNFKYISIFAALSLMPAFFACKNSFHSEHEHGHQESHDEHGEEHQHADGEIVFTPEKAKRFNVTTTKIALSDFNEIIRVSGQISPAQGDELTVIAHSAGAVKLSKNAVTGSHISAGASLGYISAKNIVGGDANENARITYLAAKRELDRITPLYKDKIVTEKDYIATKENYEKARIAYSSHSESGSAATTSIAGTITKLFVSDGEYVEAGTPIAIVSKNARLILRADLPERYAQTLSLIKSATFKPAYTDEVFDIATLNGHRTSSNAPSAMTPGYIPVFFEFNNNGSIIPGTFAEIYLVGASKPNSIVLPLEAITEEQGEYFTYVKIDDDCYMKKPVTIGMNNGTDVEILSGLKVGEDVVTSGAIIIKMAANAGAVPGHTHEH